MIKTKNFLKTKPQKIMEKLARYLLEKQKACTVSKQPITDEWVKDVTDIHSSTFNRLKKGRIHELAYYLQWSRFYLYTDQGRNPVRLAAFTLGLWQAACSCLQEIWKDDHQRHELHVQAMMEKLEAEKQQLATLTRDDPDYEKLLHRIKQHEWKTGSYFNAQKSKQ